jgi:hypothetical protein
LSLGHKPRRSDRIYGHGTRKSPGTAAKEKLIRRRQERDWVAMLPQ